MSPIRKQRQSLIGSISRYIFKKGISLTRRLSDKHGLTKRLSELCYPEQPSEVCLFDNLPNEVMLTMLDHFSLESLNSFALTSKKNMAFTKAYYLSPAFRSKMDSNSTSLNLRVFQQFLTVQEKADFAVELFRKHFYDTPTDFPWASFLYNVQTLIHEDSVKEFQTRLLEVLQENAEKMVNQKYHGDIFNEEGLATSFALRMILTSLISRDDLCYFLCMILRWVSITKKRAILILLIYAPMDYQKFCDVDLSTMADARENLSSLAQALEVLSAGSVKGVDDCLTTDRVFSLIENITTYPSPWVMRNYISLLLLSPETCYLTCFFRTSRLVRKNSYSELRDMVYETVCYFAGWDQCYLDTFYSIIRNFNY